MPSREAMRMLTRNELTPVQESIIRGDLGLYRGSVYDLMAQGLWNKAVNYRDPRQLKLQRTEKTTRKCRTCFGNKTVEAVYKGHGSLVTTDYCPQCGGTGEVFG